MAAWMSPRATPATPSRARRSPPRRCAWRPMAAPWARLRPRAPSPPCGRWRSGHGWVICWLPARKYHTAGFHSQPRRRIRAHNPGDSSMNPFTVTTRRAIAGACALLALGLAGMAHAAWPEKTVTLVVPYSAGGPTDVVARLLAIPMGHSLGQTVVVENTVGAGGTLAPARIVRSKADGYTIMIHHMGMATAPALYKKLPYDPLKDFEYIGQVLDVPMTLLSRKDFPANTFPELLDYVKKNQDKVSLANAGTGAVSQLCGMLFMHQVGVKLTTVPYKGAGPAMNDLMGGQVDL